MDTAQGQGGWAGLQTPAEAMSIVFPGPWQGKTVGVQQGRGKVRTGSTGQVCLSTAPNHRLHRLERGGEECKARIQAGLQTQTPRTPSW